MTQAVETSIFKHVTNGAIDTFAYNCTIDGADQLVVYLTPDSTGIEVVVNPALYTVSDPSGPGDVVFTVAPEAGTLAIVRQTPIDNTNSIPASGAWDRTTVETQADDTTRQIQDLRTEFELRAIKVKPTESAEDFDAAGLVADADRAENAADAAEASATSAATSAATCTSVASGIQQDADDAVAAEVASQVPPAVEAEVDAQVPPAVDTAVNTALLDTIIPAAEVAGGEAAEQYMDANLNTQVDIRVEQIADDKVSEEIEDQLPPAVETEVSRVVGEEIIDIQQDQAQELVDDGFKDVGRGYSDAQVQPGGILTAMQVTRTVVVPPGQRYTCYADSIASGAEVVVENGGEYVTPNTDTIELVQKVIPAAVQKETLTSLHFNETNANTTTSLNGTIEAFVDTIDDVEWEEGDTLRLINVGLASCSIEASTDVVFVPAGNITLDPENQCMLELIDRVNNKWFATLPS